MLLSTTTTTANHANKLSNVAKLILAISCAILATTPAINANYESDDGRQAAMLSLLLAPGYTAGANRTIELALEQLAPDLRQLRDFTLPTTSVGKAHNDALSLELSLGAWKLMRNQAQQAVKARLQLVEPILVGFLNEARVSGQCLAASKRTLDAARSLESWAIQLFSSWASFPPAGLFEGTFGDLGSYHGCMQVPENMAIGHAHYCTISFRPLMPPRADFELIVSPLREPLKSLFGQPSSAKPANQSSVDIFADLINFSQYFHYVFLKLGTCFPIDCTPRDVQKVARLIGRRWSLQTGPVKCNSKFASDYAEPEQQASSPEEGNSQMKPLQISTTRDLNQGVFIWKPHMTRSQFWALIILGSIVLAISAATLLDLLLNQIPKLRKHLKNLSTQNLDQNSSRLLRNQKQTGTCAKSHELDVLHSNQAEDANNNNECANYDIPKPIKSQFNQFERQDKPKSWLQMLIQDLSFFENAKSFFTVTRSPRDISCMHGIRCLTMMWIIITHTMQYNDWSAFARAREVEVHLRSLVTQPIFNGSYLVDTFFVMSGLLTSYTIFSQKKSLHELGKQFSCFKYLLNRYLRLTPAMLFVSGLFILLPLSIQGTGSPHWYTMTGEYSEFCTRNWWVQVFHAQAFYNHAEMCNFASWWISVDSFFHLIALAILLIIFSASRNSGANSNFADRSRQYALGTCLSLALLGILIQFAVHYHFKLPPNMMSTIPQTEAMFSITTLYFYWTPISHSIPFLLGLLAGYLLARERELLLSYLNWERALLAWCCVLPLFVLELFGTYLWIIGEWDYKPFALMASTYNVTCTFWWSATLIWIIVACKLGFGGPINALLSCNFFVVLSKASFLVYLSHFLVLFSFFGSQNLLLEPSQILITYVFVGNICISMLFGSFLCVMLEMPWLKLHKRLMSKGSNEQQQTSAAAATTTTSDATTQLGA